MLYSALLKIVNQQKSKNYFYCKMSSRPKRQVKIKSETPVQCPRRWSSLEMETLLSCLMEYGHKDLEKLQVHLPSRSIENIKAFIRTVYDTAGKIEKNNEVLDEWIQLCDTPERTPWRDCIQIAQILKYLSVDGLLENHPLPNRCDGIDFGQAYRLLYQAMMGYPIQPVNKATADFVFQSLAELNCEIKKQTNAIKNVDSFLKAAKKTKISVVKSEIPTETSQTVKKPLKVYERKRKTVSTSTAPSLKITIQATPDESGGASGYSKDFSLTVEGNNCSQSTTVNVPVACEKTVNKDEEELLESSSYNPFKIPGHWLEEPLYLNLLRNG